MTEEQQFTTLLNNELTSLQNLLTTIHQEYDALIGTDVEALEIATLQKNNALAKQAETTIARQNYVVTVNGKSAEEIELKKLITKYSNQAQLLTTLNQLHVIAEQCQTANRTNGKLILQKQQYTRNALDILRQADSKPSTYSGQGDSVTQTEGRILGKA
jgi:flagellar biosynthesis/type III secretory pathway chaperone